MAYIKLILSLKLGSFFVYSTGADSDTAPRGEYVSLELHAASL